MGVAGALGPENAADFADLRNALRIVEWNVFGVSYGDGRAELLARAADGLHTYRWNAETGRFDQVGATLTDLSSANGWYLERYYQTIQTADVDGGPGDELLARGGGGLHTWRWSGAGWTASGPVLGDLSDAAGWNHPQYYQTIQTADVDGDGKAELLLARGGAGLHTWKRSGDAWSHVLPVLDALSNANGGDKPARYVTIQTGDLDGDASAELLARDAGGMVVWPRAGDQWTRVASGTPALADDPWAKAQHYATIQTGDADGDGRADLFARGVFGMRTFIWDAATNTFGRPRPCGRSR